MPPQKELVTLVKHYILLYFLTKTLKTTGPENPDALLDTALQRKM